MSSPKADSEHHLNMAGHASHESRTYRFRTSPSHRPADASGSVGAFFRYESTVMEMGWNTCRAFWGKGIANEAAAAGLKYAFEVRREPKVRALIASSNESSRRVAGNPGMTYEMKTELNGTEIDGYMRERT
jgi:RimJ/RimL family protein N-acetyltransferase